VRESLERRAAGGVLQEELHKYPRGVTVAALVKATPASDAEVNALDARRSGDWLWSSEHWRLLTQRVTDALTAYHDSHPLRPGMPREELRSKSSLPAAAFPSALRALREDAVVREVQGEVALPSHHVAVEQENGAGSRLIEELGRHRFAPPSLADAMRASGAGPEVVRALERRGDLVRLSEEVVFTRQAYEDAVAIVKEVVASEGSITVAQMRDRMGASRRPVLALLEHLDSERITRRVGDARVLR
jgi:selenocysteine-specific elongation factor